LEFGFFYAFIFEIAIGFLELKQKFQIATLFVGFGI